MSDITISRPVQIGLLLVILGAVGRLTVAQVPELQRYMKIRAM